MLVSPGLLCKGCTSHMHVYLCVGACARIHVCVCGYVSVYVSYVYCICSCM